VERVDRSGHRGVYLPAPLSELVAIQHRVGGDDGRSGVALMSPREIDGYPRLVRTFAPQTERGADKGDSSLPLRGRSVMSHR
jgi:hypothetical protein